MNEQIQKNFAKDLSNLIAVVKWASEQQLHGSFSDRRPDLGKMVRCPYCRARRRMGGERCCNPAYTKTQRAWSADHDVRGQKPDSLERGFGPTTRHEKGFHQTECAERVSENMFPKSFLKRFMHKRHGQSRQFKIRHLTFLFQHDRNLLNAAIDEMQCGKFQMSEGKRIPVPMDDAHIPAFAEKYFFWKQKRLVRSQRLFRRAQ